jgi:PPK2 family polyphosphate:nucleotide phosphotransferase
MSYSERFRVKPRGRVSLRDVPTRAKGDLKKTEAPALLTQSVARLAAAQDLLYAQGTWALLIVLQAMDAAGKDGTIKHVMSGVNPRGCQIVSFVAPTKEELDHDYLWRTVKALPARGYIGIHNRSHYEEVIVTRVHPEILDGQRLPDTTRGPHLIARRLREIRRFEQYLVDNGTVILKFFLHISKREQWRRLRERMEDPDKFWKLQPGDIRERLQWDKYMAAYEDVFRQTSTAHAPWHIIPADDKWFARLAIAEVIGETLTGLHLQYPAVSDTVRAEWDKAREELRHSLGGD